MIRRLKEREVKVRSSYGPLAYFSDIFISGKNVVFSVQKLEGTLVYLTFLSFCTYLHFASTCLQAKCVFFSIFFGRLIRKLLLGSLIIQFIQRGFYICFESSAKL